MNLLRLSSLFVVPALAASFALACGEITDPTRDTEKTATVSGALTGTSVPADARVAVVWRNANNGGVVVGAEAPIVAGKFTMTLTPPPDSYFYSPQESYDSLNDAPNVATPEPSPSSGQSSGTDPDPGGEGASSGGARIGTRTTVGGGITEPMSAATAGFVVYVDANGNGKLDLEGDYASSPDTLLGGNRELLLTYLKGGGSLDYEKLRDKSGILPVAGYNLAWDEGRWLPLSMVELQLTTTTKLPSGVCSSYGSSGGTGGSLPRPQTTEEKPSLPVDQDAGPAPDAGSVTYPPKGDPGIHCYDNGRAFYYTGNCPPPPPPPVGLCASEYGEPYGCATQSYTFSGDDPPAGWPCDVTGTGGSSGTSGTSGSSGTPIDGGPAPDAGGS